MALPSQKAAIRQSWHRLMLALMVACVLISFAALQTASVIQDHAHHHGGANHHCCAACHGGPLFALAASAKLHLAFLQASGWHRTAERGLAKSLEVRDYRTTRAPPYVLFSL